MVQHAVGKGGFFSGILGTGAQPLRWLYDCGSNQRDALTREINVVAAQGEIDLLFLSHLDSDHVGGVDQLLLQAKVREVVLPYLDDGEVIAALTRDIARGSLSSLFVEAVRDPASWFGSRGVETVTFVTGRPDEEDGGDGPLIPGTPEGGGEGDVKAKWTMEPQPVRGTGVDLAVGDLGGAAAMQQVDPKAALQFYGGSKSLNWVLIPFVHRPPPWRLSRFYAALEAAFGTPLDKKKIVGSARDGKVRDTLRACYDALWLDHNLISMTLYSGPQTRPNSANVAYLRHGRITHHSTLVGGWMLTGDAHLDSQRRGRQFLEFYKNHTPLINVMMLPHHGSIHNHSSHVLSEMVNLCVGYAASGPNSYGHPHHDVKQDVDAHGWASFHRVTQDRSSQLIVEIGAP